MSAVQHFVNLVKDYQQLKCVLSECSVFCKKDLKRKCDLSSCYNSDKCEELLLKELHDLVEECKKNPWEISISSYHIDKNRISLNLSRPSVIKSVLLEVLELQSFYGNSKLLSEKTYQLSLAPGGTQLTRLRMTLAAKVLTALITAGGGSVTTDGTEHIHLSHSLASQSVLVSAVKVSNGLDISEDDFIQLRTTDMLAMGGHKDLCVESVRQLVDAALVFDLLSVKLEKPICLDLSCDPKAARKSNCKGAPFVLYNYARLSAILERFDHCVLKGTYPPLPSLLDIDFRLLTEEDEWRLVYGLIADWPPLVAECQDLARPCLHRIPAFLSALASIFSVYYRHTRVLTEGLKHLQPQMQARIHLLLALKQVFLNAFYLLGITAPTTM